MTSNRLNAVFIPKKLRIGCISFSLGESSSQARKQQKKHIFVAEEPQMPITRLIKDLIHLGVANDRCHTGIPNLNPSKSIRMKSKNTHTHHRKLTWKSYRKIYGTVLEDDVLLFWCFLPKFLLISDSMSWYSEVWLSLVCQNNWEDDMIGATLFIQTKVPILGSVTVASITRGHRHSLRDAEVKTIQPSPKDISSGGWNRLRGIGHGYIEKCITYKYICWSYIFIDIFNHIYIYI